VFWFCEIELNSAVLSSNCLYGTLQNLYLVRQGTNSSMSVGDLRGEDDEAQRCASDTLGIRLMSLIEGLKLQREQMAAGANSRQAENEDFTISLTEWWHFDYKDWKEYRVLNVPFEKLR